MANVVYCEDNILCKYNQSTRSNCNSTHFPSSHTGIADSGSRGIYFAPNAPVTNLNLQAPTSGFQVATGLLLRLIASATLASAPSLSPVDVQGHVMPSFSRTLASLGPFANLDFAIIFTKMEVSIIHPNEHCILKGWQEPNGPHLWLFPL
jgi:hypothetical protein